MKASKKIILLIAIVFLILPSITHAVSWWPLVPCGLNAQPKDSNGVELPKVPTQADPDAHDYTQPCNQCDLLKLFKNIIDFVLIGLMPPIAAILFVWGGFLILMGGANPGWITQGKSIFWNTAIGVAIILASWLTTNSIIRSLAADNIAPEWWKFQCSITVPAQQPPVTIGTTTTGTTGTTTTGTTGTTGTTTTGTTTTTGVCANNKVSPPMDASTNLCQPRQMRCDYSACSSYNDTIQKYAGGAASANLLKAIMVKESSCNALATSGVSYGLMQITTPTANIYKNRCGISTEITPQWLKDNPSNGICIAAAYIKAIAQTSCGNSVRNIAAGYNGGSGACSRSVDCAAEKSCDGSAVKRWECVYDNPKHTICNNTRPKNYDETRDYATKVLYCYNNPGF